jgi:hypothetical protein
MSRRSVWAALTVLALPAPTWAQIPIGDEFQLNTFTTSAQAGAAITSETAGNFVAAWASYFQDGDDAGVFARRYVAGGAAVGEFRVNAYTTSGQGSPSIASDASGRFVVVWRSFGQDGDLSGVFGRRYSSSGLPGPEFRINEETMSFQQRPKVAMNASGAFVVVWQSYGQDGYWDGIFGRRYNAAGTAQGIEFRANTYTTRAQANPAVAMDTAGNFVIVWNSYLQDGSYAGIFGQRYNAAGAPQGAEFRVNTYTTGDQYGPSVAMDADGDFVVVWTADDGHDGYQAGVFGQRYDAAGVPQGGEFQINQYTTGAQGGPTLTMDPRGSFVVAWQGPFQDGSDYGVFARPFDAAGAPLGIEFQVNQFTTGHQFGPSLASAPGGRFVVSWVSYLQDGDHFGMFARQFATDLIFEDGFE